MQEGLSLRKAVAEHMASPEKREFPLEEVSRVNGYSVELCSEFQVLNLHEFTKRFGHPPRAKDPKVAKVTLTNQLQQQETVWVFRDPGSLGRRLKLSTRIDDQEKLLYLEPSKHMHEQQGMKMVGWTHKQQLCANGLEALLGNTAHQLLCTVDEYEAKLSGKASTTEPAASVGTSGDGGGASSSIASGSVDNMTVEVEDSPLKDEQLSTAPVMRLPGAGSDSVQKKRGEQGIKRKLSGISNAEEGTKSMDEDDGTATQRSLAVSSGAQKKGKQASKAETDQKQAERYIQSLDLNLVLSGRKLGVVLRHAKEESRKMEMRPKLLLSAHTKLVEQVLMLAPQNIKMSSAAQIQEAFDVISQDGRQIQWPLELQEHMMDLHAKPLTNQLTSSMDTQSLQELWRLMRPYALPGAKVELDVQKPLLHSMGHDGPAKIELCFDVMLSQVLLTLVQSGEVKKAHVKWLCEGLLDMIKSDLLNDIEPECMVVALSQLQSVLVGLHTVIDGRWETWRTYQDEVSYIRKPPSEAGYVQQISNALMVDEFWRSQLKQLQSMQQMMCVHEASISKLQEYLDVHEPVEDLPAEILSMETHLKEFTDLKYHLPEGALSTMATELSVRLEALWKLCRESHQGSKEQACSSSLVQALLAEGAIAFPEAAWVKTAQVQFSEMLLAKKGEEKMAEMLRLVNKFFKSLLTNEIDDVDSVLCDCLEHMDAARGLPMPAEAVEEVTSYWQTVCDEVNKLSTDYEAQVLVKLAEVMEKLLPWLPSLHTAEEAGMAKMTRLKACCKLHLIIDEYNALPTQDVARYHGDCYKRTVMTSMMSSQIALANIPDMPFLQQRTRDLLARAEKLKGLAAESWLASCKEAVDTAMLACREVAGGMGNGQDWDQGLGATASYDKVLAKAQTGLLKGKIKSVGEKKDDLQEVPIETNNPGTALLSNLMVLGGSWGKES